MHHLRRRSPALVAAVLAALAVAGTASDAGASLYITEFLALNVTGLADQDGDRSDWLEIHNDGAAPASLAGWHLTDDATVPAKWTFPAVSIPAGGYLVVFASDKNRAVAGQQLHTNFKLSGGGEYLGLVRADGTIEDEYAPAFPSQNDDISWGLTNDLSQQRCFTVPTPGAANQESPTCGIVERLSFSPERGFFDSPQSVAITTPTPGAQIWYTLDGSDPGPTNGTLYTAPIPVTTTAIVRAVGHAPPLQPTVSVTHTYLFLDDVIHQTGAGFPTEGFAADYEMDPRVVNDPRYASGIVDDLRAVPSISIVMNVDDWFGEENGIYTHPSRRGSDWERAASAEMILSDGSTAWQANCGTRIQGRLSRVKNPKKSLRLSFKSKYGPPHLEYPLFPDTPVTSFDKLRLRASHNKSWSFGILRADYIRDQWARDTQIDMGQVASHGIFTHVYLNGLYWGLYNVVELPEAEFAASYYGGLEEEWDIIEPAETDSGTREAWLTALDISRAGLETPAAYAEIRQYVDVTNLADYMITNMHAGTRDWDDSNWYAARRRLPGEGFHFFSWDAEQSMEFVNARVTGVHHEAMPSQLYTALRQNAEFRLLFADRVHRHFFNDGALTAENARERYMERVAEIEHAIVAESARWGDSRNANDPLDRDSDWIPEIEWLRLAYFPRRSAIVLQQFRDIDLYPNVVAPVFEPAGGFVAAGGTVAMTAPAGVVYYTTDGSDPRLEGGAVSPAAVQYSSPIAIPTQTVLKARVLQSGTWSALNEGSYGPDVPLRVTEMMYNPADPPVGSPYVDDDFEFLEITNVGTAPVDLGGIRITQGITFTFPAQSLAPGAQVLAVRNATAFPTRYGAGKPVAGQYSGRLANEGERIRLQTAAGDEILDYSYADSWYPETDGGGHSLVPADPAAPREAWSTAAGWRASSFADGSPGAPEPAFCADGLDNDGDGAIDFGGDPGCGSAEQNDETPACNDGADNDDDGFTDLGDPHCTSASDGDEAGAPIDAFACFSARATSEFDAAIVSLTDEVEVGRLFEARSPAAICAPAVIDGARTLLDAATHLEGFSIRPADGLDTPDLPGVFVESLGPLYVDTYEADRLLVPASVENPPSGPPADAGHSLDRYKCYRVKPAVGLPRLFPGGVVLRTDSTIETSFYDFKTPSRVCNPVSVDGSAIRNAAGKLVCYRGRRSNGQAPHVPRVGMPVSTELGATTLETKRVEEICVPAH